MKIKTIYELSKYDYKKLYLKEWDEFALFDDNCDFLIDENWNRLYFYVDRNTIYVSDYDDFWEYYDKLLEFCENQNYKISRWWYNTRLETKKRKYFDDDKEFDSYKWLKIAYRWWVGYYYTLFKYID